MVAHPGLLSGLLSVLSANLFMECTYQLRSVLLDNAGDKDKSGVFEFDEFLNMYKKCLATPNLKKKYEQKIVMRHQNGEW